MYDPKANIPYPEFTDGHYRDFGELDDIAFDKDYPYVDKSPAFLKKKKVARFLLRLIVFPWSYVKLGLRIKGKENLKNNKGLLEQGAISVCNHVAMWDYIAIMNAIKPFKPYILVAKDNVAGKDGAMVRQVGGIPIPENDMAATKAYLTAVKDLLYDGGWLHIYAEGSMWEYYPYIRPFKKGAATLARMTKKPIVPMAFSYRKPSWIRRKIFKQVALFDLHIGKPLFLDESLPSVIEQELDLLRRAHSAVVSLAGLTEIENRYPAVFNNSRRID